MMRTMEYFKMSRNKKHGRPTVFKFHDSNNKYKSNNKVNHVR